MGMGRGSAGVFLDTHVVLWLHASLLGKISPKAVDLIEANELFCPHFVKLELQYLYEIHRIRIKPAIILNDLCRSIGLGDALTELSFLIEKATQISWTRDVFDRLISAEAEIHKGWLVTRDENILKHCKIAVW